MVAAYGYNRLSIQKGEKKREKTLLKRYAIKLITENVISFLKRKKKKPKHKPRENKTKPQNNANKKNPKTHHTPPPKKKNKSKQKKKPNQNQPTKPLLNGC